MVPPAVKDQDENPEDLAEELPSQAGVRVFRVPVERLVIHARDEITRGMENPHPVPDELLPLLEHCRILGAEAFELVTIPKQDCPARLRSRRARALGFCRRWYTARFHTRLRNCPMTIIFPHAEGWQE